MILRYDRLLILSRNQSHIIKLEFSPIAIKSALQCNHMWNSRVSSWIFPYLAQTEHIISKILCLTTLKFFLISNLKLAWALWGHYLSYDMLLCEKRQTSILLSSTSFQVVVESNKVSSEPPFLQTGQHHLPQLFLIRLVFQTLHQLHCPLHTQCQKQFKSPCAKTVIDKVKLTLRLVQEPGNWLWCLSCGFWGLS